MPEIICKNESATAALAAKFAGLVEPPMVLALTGGLGAGKTFFTAALVKSLGGMAAVASPTFSLMNIYACPEFKVYHFDLYRLDGEDELDGFGFFEYLDERRAVKIVEWADKFPAALPDDYLEINFSRTAENFDGAARRLRFAAHGKAAAGLLVEIEKIAGFGD